MATAWTELVKSARSPKDEECCGGLRKDISAHEYTVAQILLGNVSVECCLQALLRLSHSLGDEAVPLFTLHMLVTVKWTQHPGMHVFSMQANGPNHALPCCKAYLQPHTDSNDCLKPSKNIVTEHTRTHDACKFSLRVISCRVSYLSNILQD